MYALWNPKPNTVLKPGYCGYFDEQGSWNQIVDLSNQEEATKFNYTQDLPEPEEDGLGKWEPACSENVKWRRAALEAPAKIPQLGIELKMKLEFSKDDKYGACLVTGPTVTCKYFSNRITLFDEWAKSNYSSISSSVRDVKDHGLWIITKVYETPRCAVAGWAGPASSLSLYAGAGAIFGGAITLQGTIAEERTSALWKFLPDDDSKSDSGWNSFTGNIFKSKSEVSEYIPRTVKFALLLTRSI
ncbi:hypothetical protein FNYG_12987 [Fusarium nygamai]|uniref:Uncharacterized protein n=1 Tax=Gibberella nygamai TaxID=42673 RepID=A0A2K0VUT4_GIBNY|nr:hypothetical protein FNYG_12987 [Fusarium nygamai]